MPRSRPRPFTLGDAMALVAASAFGFALVQWEATPRPMPPGLTASCSYGRSRPTSWPGALWLGGPTCFAAAWTLALAALRWRRPRPPASRILRQPGALACLAVGGSILLNGGLVAVDAWVKGPTPGDAPPCFGYVNGMYWNQARGPTSLLVAGLWLTLALGGRWSPERSWIDRAGIATGCYWLGEYVVFILGAILDHLAPYPP